MTKKKINNEQILALCAIRPMNISDMAAAIDAKPQSMCRYTKALLDSGQLEIASSPEKGEKSKGRKSIYYQTVPIGDNAKAVIEDGKLILKSSLLPSIDEKVMEEKISEAKAKKIAKASLPLSEELQEELVQKIAEKVTAQLSDIISTLGDRIAVQVFEQISASLAKPVEVSRSVELGPLPPKVKQEEKTPVTKVGVVGLLPIQASALQQDFKEIPLEICFWNDNGVNRLKGMGAHCEKVFVHVSHVSHKSIGVLKSIGASIEYVNGGRSNMKVAIEKFISNSRH